jgi:hypothetical protein
MKKDCDGDSDLDWLTQQTQQAQLLQQQQQLQSQLNRILSNDKKLEQLRKSKEKVGLSSVKPAMRLLK